MIDAKDTREFLSLKLSGNQLPVMVSAADSAVTPRTGLEYRLSLLVQTAYNSGVFEELVTLVGRESPDSDQPGAPFEIDSLLDSLLERPVPNLSTIRILPCTSLTLPYYVRSEIYNNQSLIAGTAVTNPVEYVLKAKLSTEQFAIWRDSFFSVFLAGKRQFLTWAPAEKEVDPEQPEWLYYLMHLVQKPIGLRLRVQLVFEDGTKQVITALGLDGLSQFTVYSMPVGFNQLGLAAYETAEKRIHHYQVWISDDRLKRLSEVRTYYVSANTPRNVRYIVFANSLGGFDTLRCTGQASESLKFMKTEAMRSLPTGYLPDSAELFVMNKQGQRTLTISTGLAFDPDQLTYYQDLAFSEQLYVCSNEGLISIVHADESYKTREDDEYTNGRNFTFRYAKTEVGFSDLPKLTAQLNGRPTIWVPKNTYCVVNPETGIRIGQIGAAKLQLYYADTYEPVPGVALKNNVPDTAGYVPPEESSACTPATTPYRNNLESRLGTFLKNDCVAGVGEKAMINIPANSLGGNTPAELNARIEAKFLELDTQAFANANGSCTINPWLYTVMIPAGQFNVRSNNPAAMSIGSYPGRAYGNGWDMQDNIGDPYVYAPASNDMLLPVGTTYDLACSRLNGRYTQVKLYKNGALQTTSSISALGTTLRFSDIGITVASQDKLYIYFY